MMWDNSFEVVDVVVNDKVDEIEEVENQKMLTHFDN